MDGIQKEVLRVNHLEIINSLDLKRSYVLDYLLEDEVISSGEQDDILSFRTPREQNTKLLYVIKRRGDSSFDSLRNALQEDYGFLAKKLTQEGTSCRTHGFHGNGLHKKSSNECLHCLLLGHLIPDDITHALFQEGLISDDGLEYFNNKNIPRQKRVFELLKTVAFNTKITQTGFIDKLQKKYSFIVEYAQEHPNEVIEVCSCSTKKTDQITDNYCGEIETSNKICPPRASKKTPQKEIGLLHETFERKPTLQQSLHRVLPSAKHLRRCSNIWNPLFKLREKGDWIMFSKVVQGALKKFTDPDLLIMMYRSVMCIATFYVEDLPKASEMFDQAMQILPRTCMYNWHLSRILPLKIHQLIRENKLDEASTVLRDAHQVMATLKPCVSTGNVYCIEALYLCTILRNTAGGTKSNEISEKVKNCFLTSIKHYEKEEYFGLSSFSNQMYLLLALFCLGIDVGKIRYAHVQKDLKVAGHYLDKFEKECWEASTNWSQMLFYIARAEEHKLLNNWKRSVEYSKLAMDCAVNGGFKEHEHFIEINTRYFSDKITQNGDKENDRTADDILHQMMDSSDESEASSTI